MTPRIRPCGDAALSVEFGDVIDPEVNARVIALARRLEAAPPEGLVELVPTYRALLLRYDPEIQTGEDLGRHALSLCDGLQVRSGGGRLWTIPVVYGQETGQDLAWLAEDKGMTPDEVIALHASVEYAVYMIGFAPGFAYLGGLPERLHAPRLSVPRQRVPAGAIGIGGRQASINSVAGPSGWRYIGWTPLRAFVPERADPFLLRAGDRVRFSPVSPAKGAEIADRIAQGDTQPEMPDDAGEGA